MIDVLVAGAGPSGLAAAIAAARRGMRVTVVDPHAGVIDKACGEGLMPGAVDVLATLGVQPARSRPFHGIRYVRGDVVARGALEAPALGVRRTVLHQALLDAADAAGVVRVVGRVTEVRQDDTGVRAAGLHARWLVAADGARSPIRRALDLDVPVRCAPRFGIRRHFAVAPWSDTVDVHWADDAEAYVTPVDDALVGVAILYGARARDAEAHRPGRPFDRLLTHFPELAERLVDPANEARGAGPFAVASRKRVAGRVLLLGDAAGYVDPLTGEGIKLGVQGAVALVDALIADAPARWEADWRRLWRPYAWSTWGLLGLTAVPPLRRALPGVLRRAPWIFDRALRVLAT
ncbi:MAG: NAD(P)/FAD-dependent oxidoreductase [Alphaproteobacteria bacterium]|nr:NAD(P)/FAD-dependent oxidoreductase [Alphaproteobacteria bacterium]